MKLLFPVPSKSSSKPPNPLPEFNDDEQNDDESGSLSPVFVTEFDSSVALADDDTSKAKKKLIIIPPKENEWMPMKAMKNLDHQFETEPPPSLPLPVGPVSGLSYGLNVRKSSSVKKGVVNKVNEAIIVDADEERVPQTAQSVEEQLLKKLKEDLERLPEHRGAKEYEDCPVEGFGAALLAGYGWYEGRGIGKNAKGDVKCVQYERKSGTGTQGLGFVEPVPGSGIVKMK